MSTPVFLLAAGLGTRLRPLTDELPKPLLPVGDRPALAHVLAQVRGLGGPVVANAHYKVDALRAYLEGHAPDVALSEERTILGTAGGLAHAAALLGEGDVLVWNGDIVSSLDPRRVVDAHATSGDAEGTLAIRPLRAGEGNVGVDVAGRVVRLRNEQVRSAEVTGGSFLGIHLVGARLRTRLPAEGCLVGDVYLPSLRAGVTLRTVDASDDAWHDIGTLRDYEQANRDWLASRGGSYVHPTAYVAPGVTVRGSVVGAGARVTGEGALDACVVWPGASAVAPCRASVVTRSRVVPFSG